MMIMSAKKVILKLGVCNLQIFFKYNFVLNTRC